MLHGLRRNYRCGLRYAGVVAGRGADRSWTIKPNLHVVVLDRLPIFQGVERDLVIGRGIGQTSAYLPRKVAALQQSEPARVDRQHLESEVRRIRLARSRDALEKCLVEQGVLVGTLSQVQRHDTIIA